MTNTNKHIFMGIAVAAAIALFVNSSATMVLAQQTGNMTAGGGDLIKKLISASVKAKALKTIINNKDVFVVVCDPGTTNPGTNCKVFSLSPQDQ